jgi:hypothetical protein
VSAEPVPDRNRRVFREAIWPELRAALQGVALGGGEIGLGEVSVYDTRVDVTVVLNHRVGSAPGWLSRGRLMFDTNDRRTRAFLDFEGNHRFQPVQLDRPVVLPRNPFTGQEAALRFEPLDKAVKVLNSLPGPDERTAAAAAAFRSRLRSAFTPLLGPWYRQGDPRRRCLISFGETGPRIADETGWGWIEGYEAFRLLPDGSVQAMLFHGLPAAPSPDGRRFELPGIEDWLARAP